MALESFRSGEPARRRVRGCRQRVWRLTLLGLAVGVITAGLGTAKPAHAASAIPVDCTTDSSALAVALMSATDGDTLAIQGTCKGTFEIAHSLTLAGNGGATLDGQGAGTVLTIDAGTTVAVNNLAITGGHTDTANNSVAGGIQNSGTLTLTNSTVYGNTATVPQFRNGVGGIFNQGGSLTLVDSTVRVNSASATAPFDTAVGGIMNLCCASSVTLTNSTVSGNSGSSPSDAFGGILNSAPGSVLTLTNSTVSGNSASAPGGPTAFSAAVGGISNSGGTLTLTSSTISHNSVSEPNGGFTPPVAGVSDFFGGTLTIANSLIALQSGGPNCYGPNSDAGYNLDDGTSCGFSAVNHSLSSTDPLLDPAGLKDNGGATQTIALGPGSPAIDAIPSGINGCGTTIMTDQRGVSRPQGAGCDFGAFEFVPPGADLSITKSGSPSPVVSGDRLTYTLIVMNNGPQNATSVTVSDPLPNSVHFVSVASSQGSCTRSTTTKPAPKGGRVNCNLGDLANGTGASITIVATTTTPGTLTNTATVSGNETDPTPLNNSATATTTVIGT